MEPSVNLCMGCMNELEPDGSCSHCSYTDDIPHLQSYLAPRTVLDNRYIIGKMLSYNGEGASYMCYDTVGKCKCVCREYMPDTLCERDSDGLGVVVNPDCLAKYKTFMSEFADMNKVLSRMRNLSHIVTATDMFFENNTTYVILEYVEGVSLKKFLQSNTGFLTWEQVKKLFVPLFTTLSIIHNSGMIHRGISPENIIVTTDGELKLTGFCISSIRTSNTGLIPEFYSGYTAPEQYSSLQWQGTWTDVYAVAAVIYRILTGCMPLDANTRINNDTLVEASRINPRIPSHISRVIAKAMAVRGEDRIQTVTELVAALFERHSVHVEHTKGATQTIPVQHVPSRERSSQQQQKKKKKAAQKKKTNAVATIIGLIVLMILFGLAIYLVIQLISPGTEEETPVDPNDGYYYGDSDNDEDNYNYGTMPVTEEPEPADDNSSPLGVGSYMPDIVGMNYYEVERRMGKEFTLKPKYYYSESDEPGYVKTQSIPEGTEYDPALKNELVIDVCAGPPQVPVPDFKGYSKRAYLALLDSMNIKYQIANEKSATVEVDQITRTSIEVGNYINVAGGQVLTVYVCDGKPKESSTKATTTQNTQAQNYDPQPQQTEAPQEEPVYGDGGEEGGEQAE
ncbi:MAG: PASTA domain-containing protein [Ruminococcus sp.]|nr:PASTA domain-containing protein [Ruminococcus sp.]